MFRYRSPETLRKIMMTTEQKKLTSARNELKAAMIERDEEIDMVLTAMIAGENPLLVGPPGTAKSMLLDSLASWVHGKKFSVLLNKFSVPEEIFGPLNLPALKEGRYERVTRGKLPDADFAFMDEIFKASSAILNTTLKILNEREYDNAPVPLLVCVGASNEWPTEKGLGAMFDRFLLRKTVSPIAGDAARERLMFGAKSHKPKLSTTATPDEIRDMGAASRQLEWAPSAKKSFMTILYELNKAGINPGDRRCFKSKTAVEAFAYLNGADQVEGHHLECLKWCLWENPEDHPRECAKIVAKYADPVAGKLAEYMSEVESVMKTTVPMEAVPKLKKLLGAVESLDARHQKVKDAKIKLKENIKSMYDKVIDEK